MVTGQTTAAGIVRIGSLERMVLGKNIYGEAMSKMFYNINAPHNFNVMVSRIWASQSRFYPKFFTNATVGSSNKNYHVIESNNYQWDAIGDIDRTVRIMESASDLTNNTAKIVNGMIGQGNQQFEIIVDMEYLSTGLVCQTEYNEYNILIQSDPIPYGNYYKLICRVQSSDENFGIPVQLFDKGRTLVDIATSIPDYGTPAMPGLGQLGTGVRFKNVVGKYGRSFTLDEVVMREELRRAKTATNAPFQGLRAPNSAFYSFSPSDFVNGVAFTFPVYYKNPTTGQTESALKGGFFSFLEAKVEDMIMLDREAMSKFGRKMDLSTFNGSNGTVSGTATQHLVAPGLRESMKDGHVRTHSGNFSAADLQSYLHGIFLTRTEEEYRKVCFVTGELGKLMFHDLVDIQAQGYLMSAKGNQFIDNDPKGTYANSLKFGYQFTKYIGFNGVEVSLEYDKMLDDRFYCRTMYRKDSKFTIDSARMEIYDFGNTSAANTSNAGGLTTNCSMVIQNGMDRVHWRIGAMHPYKGYLAESTTDDMTSTYTRTLSGSPVIWDTSRVGYIAYKPTTI